MMSVLSMKAVALSEDTLEVCADQKHTWNRNRIQGKSILASRL